MEQIKNIYYVAQDEIKGMKNRLKGNMSLIEARKLIFDEIIYEMKKI